MKDQLTLLRHSIISSLSKALQNPYDEEEILIAITIRPEVKENMLKDVELVMLKETDPFNICKYKCDGVLMGIKFYVMPSQKEPIIKWYKNQKEELDRYLDL